MKDSYPSTLALFRAWAKAMEMGATVGKPRYQRVAGPGRTRSGRRRRRRRSRANKGKKED